MVGHEELLIGGGTLPEPKPAQTHGRHPEPTLIAFNPSLEHIVLIVVVVGIVFLVAAPTDAPSRRSES
jgi:hypothetical protein